MGYIFLFLSLFGGVTKGYCGKITSVYIKNNSDNVFIGLIRMIFCVIIGFVLVFFQDGIHGLQTDKTSLLISLLAGISTVGFVFTWICSVQKGAYMMVDIFLMLGVIVPTTACRIFFDEDIKINQIIGFIFLLAATYIMCTYNFSIKGKMTLSSFLILTLCGFFNGISDFSQKLFLYSKPVISTGTFNFYTYLFSALLLFIIYPVISKSSETSERKNIIKQTVSYVIILAICLFLSSYFKIQAAKYISAAVLYPMLQGLSLIFSLGLSALFFNEKITKKCIFGVVTAFIGLLAINLP